MLYNLEPTMDEDGDSDIDMDALEALMAGAGNEDNQPSQESAQKSTEPQSLSSFLEELDNIPVKVPQKKTLKSEKATKVSKEESVVHSGDTDSEDDEDKKYFHSRQYNEYGSSIKKMLQAKEESGESSRFSGFNGANSKSWKSAPKPPPGTLCTPSAQVKQPAVDLNVDKLIGVRITNPIVSSTVLAERLQNRRIVSFATIKNFTSNGKINEDWVVVGVIVSKSPPRTSAKGSTYSILRLSDLRGVGDLKTVSLFLFSSACKTHNKNSVGSVLGILNPSIFDSSKNHGDEAALSVDLADRIMLLGTSRDFAVCKSKKKNGENCTSFVNKASCDFCVYHVKQEYQNCSRRSELQSSFSGKGLTGGLNGLRNKVLGKSEVFYGGQSFSAIPAKKSNKLSKQDNQRLSVLSGMSTAPVKRVPQPKGRLASSVELSHRQAKKDVDRLRKLDDLGIGTNPPETRTLPNASSQNISQKVQVEESKNETLAFISKARESAASKPATPAVETNENSEVDSLPAPPKTPQLSRGAAFAFAATHTNSATALNQPSAFGLGRKSKPITSEMDSPLRSQKSEGSFEISPSCVKNGEKLETPKRLKEEAPTKPPVESKVLSKFIENRITKAMVNTPKTPVDETPSIFKASEFGLGRGRKVTPLPKPSRVVPTIATSVPTLGAGVPTTGVIEFDLGSPPSNTPKPKTPVGVRVSNMSSPKSSQSARLKALSYVRANGPFKKTDPHKFEMANRKKSVGNETPTASKRKIEEAVEGSVKGTKKMKSLEDEKQKEKMAEFKALMEVTSKHVDLVAKADLEAKDEYFDKLERKEQMEEKMLNTFKMACKAVTCKQCKYTAFSASDLCKAERHPLKVHDATKRFFKCADCGNRTCCLEIIPLKTCSNCNSSRWERTAMIRERKVGIGSETLSIRGGEEKFIGSVVTGSNLNLLVPE